MASKLRSGRLSDGQPAFFIGAESPAFVHKLTKYRFPAQYSRHDKLNVGQGIMAAICRWLIIGVLLVFVSGCGSAADKGKNKEKDVPKAAQQAKPTPFS